MTVRHRDLARYGLFGETEIGAHTFDTILGVPIPDGRQALRVVHRTYSCGNRLKNWSPERPGDQRCILLNGDRRIEVGSGQTLGRALARHESATAVPPRAPVGPSARHGQAQAGGLPLEPAPAISRHHHLIHQKNPSQDRATARSSSF